MTSENARQDKSGSYGDGRFRAAGTTPESLVHFQPSAASHRSAGDLMARRYWPGRIVPRCFFPHHGHCPLHKGEPTTLRVSTNIVTARRKRRGPPPLKTWVTAWKRPHAAGGCSLIGRIEGESDLGSTGLLSGLYYRMALAGLLPDSRITDVLEMVAVR